MQETYNMSVREAKDFIAMVHGHRAEFHKKSNYQSDLGLTGFLTAFGYFSKHSAALDIIVQDSLKRYIAEKSSECLLPEKKRCSKECNYCGQNPNNVPGIHFRIKSEKNK